jgi:hypothetical protein
MTYVKFVDVLKGRPYAAGHYKIPEVPGVYIYGLLLDFISASGQLEQKFCPTAVGESGNLWRRLHKDKYERYKTGGKGVKELFDFSHTTNTRLILKRIYNDMYVYDNHLNGRNKLTKLIGIMNKGGMNDLIYFQDFNFFNHKLGLPTTGKKDDKNHIAAVSELRKISSLKSYKMAVTIEMTKVTYKDKFYFVLAFDEQTDGYNIKRDRENIESNAKFALQEKNIFTTEKHQKNAPKISIDLSEIEDILVDL